MLFFAPKNLSTFYVHVSISLGTNEHFFSSNVVYIDEKWIKFEICLCWHFTLMNLMMMMMMKKKMHEILFFLWILSTTFHSLLLFSYPLLREGDILFISACHFHADINLIWLKVHQKREWRHFFMTTDGNKTFCRIISNNEMTNVSRKCKQYLRKWILATDVDTHTLLSSQKLQIFSHFSRLRFFWMRMIKCNW